MDQYKDLVAAQIVRNKHVQPEVHKDKLAQTKAREKEVKEAVKELKETEKQHKEKERLEHAQANKFVRAFNHNSKRAAKDDREEAKKQEKAATGFMCEHGVWRCRICNPVTKHK
eukprot:jgi/Chrzof1/4361/Cz14g10100.t1